MRPMQRAIIEVETFIFDGQIVAGIWLFQYIYWSTTDSRVSLAVKSSRILKSLHSSTEIIKPLCSGGTAVKFGTFKHTVDIQDLRSGFHQASTWLLPEQILQYTVCIEGFKETTQSKYIAIIRQAHVKPIRI